MLAVTSAGPLHCRAMTEATPGDTDQTKPRGPSSGDYWLVTGLIGLVGLGLVGVFAFWGMSNGFTEDEGALYARISKVDHPAIASVWLSEDTMNTVFVDLVGSASDQDARDVWCDVIGQAAIDWHVSVAVQTDTKWWDAPARCSDPLDVPPAT